MTLPEMTDFAPQSFDPQDDAGDPVPPLARAHRAGRRSRWTWATARGATAAS